MRLFLLSVVVFFTTPSFGTTITIFSEDGQCHYYLMDDNGKMIANWSGDGLENIRDSKTIDIAENSTLWKELRMIEPTVNLKNIKIQVATEQKDIDMLKSLSIPTISLDNAAVKQSLVINHMPETKTNSISTAQDYNSSRSNKANSISESPLYDSNTGTTVNPLYDGKNQVRTATDSSTHGKTNSISTAQDYNSSRSNKANSISESPLYDSNTGTTVNPLYDGKNQVSTVADSSTHGKTNSISTAQDYNSSRSNKANSISESPLYDSNTGTTVNPLYDGKNQVSTAADSSTHGKTNSISTAQEYNSSRSNKANSLKKDHNSGKNKPGVFLAAGMTVPLAKTYMENGFSIHAGFQFALNKTFGIEAGIGYLSNDFVYTASSLFPKEYVTAIKKSAKNRWQNISFSIGPSVSTGRKKLNATIYTKVAILMTKINKQMIGSDYSVAAFGENETSLAINPGLRIHYLIGNRFSVFINPDFLSSFKANIDYKEKDISKALDKNGKFNSEVYSSLPLEKKQMAIGLFGINAGVKFSL